MESTIVQPRSSFNTPRDNAITQQPMSLSQVQLNGQPSLHLNQPPPIFGAPALQLELQVLEQMSHIWVRPGVVPVNEIESTTTVYGYEILDAHGHRIFTSQEPTDGCTACCVESPGRPFSIEILGFRGRKVVKLERLCVCCLPLSSDDSMTVNLGEGTRLGDIIHESNSCQPKLEIRDATGKNIMWMNGPECGDCCPPNRSGIVEFKIMSSSGPEIGSIQRKSYHLYDQPTWSDAFNFGVYFRPELNIRWKTLIFSSVIFLDIMYFQNRNTRYQHRRAHGTACC